MTEQAGGAPEGEAGKAPRREAAKERRRRSPRHVRQAAKMLQGEARKILKRHAAKIAGEVADDMRACLAAIDTHREAQNWAALEDEAERLDELLHQHASFARKSPLRETIENIAIAVGVALVLRACIYEPYKIPSGSMLPTLQTGDHIFVNKFVYGVQVPFTNTVVGKDIIRPIAHGDVIVFRFPLDTKDDYIKRVIGLPGDVVRTDGERVWIKKAGEDEFEALERTRLDAPCRTEADRNQVQGSCELFRETHGDHEYTVRFQRDGFESIRLDSPVTYEVPEGHLFVMGDNRNQSKDSRLWFTEAEAVSADALVTEKDLRDLTDASQFEQKDPLDLGGSGDPDRDDVMYMAKHRAPSHNLELEVWRNSVFGDRNVFEVVGGRYENAAPTTVQALVDGGTDLVGLDKDRTIELGAEIDDLVAAETADARITVWRHDPTKTVFRLSCGKTTCKTSAQLAKWTTDVLRAYHEDHDADARDMLPPDKSVHYSDAFTDRGDVAERYAELVFAKGDTVEARVRLRAFRLAGQGTKTLRDAALATVEAGIDTAGAVPDLGEDAWVVETAEKFLLVQANPARRFVSVLECGKQRCGDTASVIQLGQRIKERTPEAIADHRRMQTLLTGADVPGFKSLPVTLPSLNEWDRVTLNGSRTGGTHSLALEIERKPAVGLAARVAELRADMREPVRVDGLGSEGWKETGTRRYVFAVASTDTIVDMTCGQGLCPDDATAERIAKRAASKAENPRNFIDPRRSVAKPFVPRGHVKGRADMIWLPRARFGKKID